MILFSHNSTSLSNDDKSRLDAIYKILQRLSVNPIYLHGHSDMQGEEIVNERIALKRALRVRDYLVAAGIDSSRFITKTWGTEKPIASNTTDAGRAKNRRVEFSLSDR